MNRINPRKPLFLLTLGFLACSDPSPTIHSRPDSGGGPDVPPDHAFRSQDVREVHPDRASMVQDLAGPDLSIDSLVWPEETASAVIDGLPADGNGASAVEAGHDTAVFDADASPRMDLMSNDAPEADGGRDTPPFDQGEGDAEVRVPQRCLYDYLSLRYSVGHFTFGVVTPSGQVVEPPAEAFDASPNGRSGIVEGNVVASNGNTLKVDTCVPSDGCQPSVYQFSLCETNLRLCSDDPYQGVPIQLPNGQRVQVEWRMQLAGIPSAPVVYWLMVRNAEAGPGQGDLLFVGTSGAKPDSTVAPWSDLPFTIEYSALGCGQPEVATEFDDYALIFAPKGGGTSLRLETKESGTLSTSTASGTRQLLVKNAFSVLTRVFGYWEFWAMAK